MPDILHVTPYTKSLANVEDEALILELENEHCLMGKRIIEFGYGDGENELRCVKRQISFFLFMNFNLQNYIYVLELSYKP